ncbi:MAG TPA: hypothetical protein VNR38_13345 [Ureibacillus sp.]|uniref:Uncharacterized protein n=1 Tax=Peribacillus asahii TaxID=228899 RepID=A0A398BP03_9BACI|nr:hypothetical protein [Peribacillus asahii]RID89076.1 hypothetical protein D1953_00435 [Peribacillus asahii]HWL24708.1 hypothetical protein [Ureibacillus sp.]
MDKQIWFRDLHDLDLEDLVQLKWNISQGFFPDADWHQRPNPQNPEGITMDEWLSILEKEFVRLGI